MHVLQFEHYNQCARESKANVSDPQVRVHHCQRHGQDGVRRVPQREGRRPRPHRGHRDARAARDLCRFGGFALEMEDAANDAHHDDDDDDDDDVMMPLPLMLP